jgi:hypothetical protein
VENTVFAVLTPDGERQYGSSGRSPHMWLTQMQDDVAGAFADQLLAVAALHGEGEAEPQKLPAAPSVRHGLNVAQCDRQPLAVVWSADPARREELIREAAKLAWSEEHRGRFAWAVAESAEDLKPIPGAAGEEGILIVQPDEFGVQGALLARGGAEALRTGLAAASFPDRDHEGHLAKGVEKGIRWRTVTPQEDRGTLGAIQRLWGG